MKQIITILIIFIFCEAHSQDNKLFYIHNSDTIEFDDQFSVFLKSRDNLKPFNRQSVLLKNQDIRFSEIQGIVVIFNSDTLTFYSGDDFSRSDLIYSDTTSIGMPSLKVPSFREAYDSDDNLYFKVMEQDEWANKLDLLPDSIRKIFVSEEDQAKNYWTISLTYHIEESQKIEIKKN